MHDPLPKHSCVAVFGLGASGLAVAHLLDKFHKNIVASDIADESKRSEFKAKLPKNTRLVLGHNEIGTASVIVTSPGLEPTTPILLEAAARNIPVIAELEVGYRATEFPIVAITGTDGKTTTTTLTSHILNECDVLNHMGGNVGIPLSHVIQDTNKKVDCLVVETSAFQLVFCPQFKPHILIATNIAEDHNEYFKGDKNKYIETKRRPLQTMTSHDIAILNASDPEIRTWYQHTQAKLCWYGLSREEIPNNAMHYAYLDEAAHEIRFIYQGQRHCLSLAQLKMPGKHNALNAMGAILAALYMGCSFDKIVKAIASYKMPSHRIQNIRTLNGISFIDDSKATNPHAAMAALQTIDEPTILIVGGVDKGLDLTEWIETMKKNVRQIMVIGALTDRFCREAIWNKIPCPLHRCNTLEEAVSRGYELAKIHECKAVMLSPGCSSYDMFKNYNQRGEIFAHAAQQLKP